MSRCLPDFAGLFCLAIFIISLGTIKDGLLRDGDTFWHIKAGSVMLEQKALLTNDIFSHTAYGTPWTAHEWLAEIIMAAVHKLAGLEGVLIFFLLLVSLSFWLLYKITEKSSTPLITLLCVAITFALGHSHLAARPHIFTWLGTTITLYILMIARKRLFVLPLVIMFWANLHGGFLIGIVLQGIFLTGSFLDGYDYQTRSWPWRDVLRQQRDALLVFCFSLLATGLNPFGFELLTFPFQISKELSSAYIGEWQSPGTLTMWIMAIYLLIVIPLMVRYRSETNWTDRLMLLFFLSAAMTHLRHLSLMFIVLTPLTARLIRIFLGELRKDQATGMREDPHRLSVRSGPVATALTGLILMLSGAIHPGVLEFLSPQKAFDVNIVELNGLTDYLNQQRPPGHLFNEYVLGGYLIYALNPPAKVFIDGRADMYSETIFRDYLKIAANTSARDKLLDQYQVDWIVYDKDSKLVKSLQDADAWERVFSNKQYVVLRRVPQRTARPDKNG